MIYLRQHGLSVHLQKKACNSNDSLENSDSFSLTPDDKKPAAHATFQMTCSKT